MPTVLGGVLVHLGHVLWAAAINDGIKPYPAIVTGLGHNGADGLIVIATVFNRPRCLPAGRTTAG